MPNEIFPGDWSDNTKIYRFWLLSEDLIYSDVRLKDSYITIVREWCKNNCESDFLFGLFYIDFVLEEDYVLVSLRFGR